MKKEQGSFTNLPVQSRGINRNAPSSEASSSKIVPQLIGRPFYHDAQYGRIACYVDGLRTSCSTALGLLRAGFAYRIG